MNNLIQYILIDDDPVSNLISLMIMRKNLPEANFTIFNVPEVGLSYLQNGVANSSRIPRPLEATILLLDINMPGMDGWEFLKRYEKFSAQIQPPINIYMLSSSVYQQDRDKAAAKKYIKGFISKPLSREAIIATKENWLINTSTL